MPSTHQRGNDGGKYPDEPTKMLATKNDATIRALVKGIRDPDRARKYIKAEIRLAEEEDREPRKKLIGMCNAKVSELTDDGGEDDDS